MDAEVLDPQLLQAHDGTCHLVLGHAVFGIPGHIHNGVAQTEGAAGVIPQTHGLGKVFPGQTLQEGHIGGVVQIDIGAQFQSLFHVQFRGNVGGEHNVVSCDAYGLGQQKLRVGGAVTAAALFLQNFDNIGIGRGLYGKILPKAGVPGKGSLQRPGIAADARLVVDVEGGGNLGRDFTGLIQRHKCLLFHGFLPL